VQWTTEARANSGNLPPGRYQYRDRRGQVVRVDHGHAACMESLRERRLQRADLTGGYSDREIRDGVAVRSGGRIRMVVK
jgi:hypothetical protein